VPPETTTGTAEVDESKVAAQLGRDLKTFKAFAETR